MANSIKALILGDLVGQSGYRAVFINLKSLIKKFNADFVVVNGENASDGFGIEPELARNLFSVGVDVITTGNHVWQKPDILPYLDSQDNILRPANYPKGTPGHGSCVVEKKGVKIAVCNFQGRERMGSLDCPFASAKKIGKELRNQTPLIICDLHAEDTAEKEAFGLNFDGKFSIIIGTHTHIQTADEKILPKGTGYLSDLGMCGAYDSVIGFQKEAAIDRAKTQLPIKMEIDDGPASISGVLAELDTSTGKTLAIQRVNEKFSF